MNRGLVFLLVHGPRGKLRQIRRRMRGLKGILAAIGIVLLLVLVLGPQVFVWMSEKRLERMAQVEDSLRTWAPPSIILLILFLGITRGALYFKPAEIQFLFPAPIPRRQLLLYNVTARLRIQLLSAVWFAIFLLPYSRLPYASFFAAFLFLAFLQITAQASGLLLAAIGEQASRRLRRLVLVVLVVVGIAAVAGAVASLPPAASPKELARAIVELPPVRVVAWATRPFVEALVAPSIFEFLGWSGIALAILLVELLAMLAFDVAYTEGAMAQGERIQKALRRIRSGGGAYAAAGPSKLRFRLPAFPAMRGAGPLAWRQCQEMVRNLRGVITLGIVMLVWVGAFAVVPALASGGSAHEGSAAARAGVAVAMVVFLMPLMTPHFPFDFRRDLDRMAYFKSLPVHPVAVAAGQILPMTALLAAWQLLGIALIAAATGALPPEMLLAVLFVIPPLDWIVGAVDNAVFLILPYRLSPKDSGHMPFLGRFMLVFMLKMIVLLVVAGLAALAAYVVWWATGHAVLLAAATGAAVLGAACIPCTIYVGAAFRAFDVSRDIPE